MGVSVELRAGFIFSSVCILIRVIILCIFRVREDGTKYKKTTIPRQFTNGKKKEKDSRTLFLKQVGNKDAIKQLFFFLFVFVKGSEYLLKRFKLQVL